MKILIRLIFWLLRRRIEQFEKPRDRIRIIDYRQARLRWGHDCTWQKGGEKISVSGWCTPVPREGDYLLLEQDGCCLYRVESVRYPGDPEDMYFAECEFWLKSKFSEELVSALNKLFEGE